MIREEKFLISHAPYAVDLDSLKVVEQSRSYSVTATAVWFRRKNGVTTSHIGKLWDYQSERPADAVAFLRALTDGRYGGNCIARWDGESFWGNVSLAEQSNYLGILVPMLNNFPEVPRGFDGWYTFHGGR